MIVDIHIETGFANCVINTEAEIEDEELADLTPEEADEYIEGVVREQVFNFISWSWAKRGETKDGE